MTVHYDAVICIFRFKNYRYDAIYIYVYIYRYDKYMVASCKVNGSGIRQLV